MKLTSMGIGLFIGGGGIGTPPPAPALQFEDDQSIQFEDGSNVEPG
jgi:hypothetical protein